VGARAAKPPQSTHAPRGAHRALAARPTGQSFRRGGSAPHLPAVKL